MNFGPRGTIGAGPLCWNLLPTLMTTSALVGQVSDRSVPAGTKPTNSGCAFREVGVDLAHLRHRHAEQFGELHGFRFGLGVVHLVADDEQRHARLDQHFRGALDVVRIGPHMHARIDQALVDDLGANALVVIVGVPGNVGRPIGRRP